MIELKSIGDKLKPGRYRVHSRFSRAINFECDGELATIVDQDIGLGPLNIVVSGIDFNSIDSLYINDTSLRLDDYEIAYDDDMRFRSSLIFDERPVAGKFLDNCPIFEEALTVYAPPKSLAFLIEPERKGNFRTSFEIQFVKRFEDGVKLIQKCNYEDGVTLLRGSGFGLTPSGDDFNAGMVAAFKFAETFTGVNFPNAIEDIYPYTIGENLISNAFLRCARDGSFSQKQKDLLTAIVFKSEDAVLESARTLCGIGETSGADWGVGFLITLKRIFN
jgi:hypothetical protein